MDYDLLIRGGRVVDGSGLPSYLADVGIKDGKIAYANGTLSGALPGQILRGTAYQTRHAKAA